MRIHALLAAATLSAALTGCYTYPVYQPAPVARLTPEQSAALANQYPPTQAQQAQMARDNAQVANQDQAAQAYANTYPVAPAYVDPYPYAYGYPSYYGYPYYYGGLYPWYPSVSLSFGFGRYYGGGYRGGYHGGYHGHR